MRRFITLVLGTMLALAFSASPALGWANGADTDGDGLGDDGYGTHDWVLDQALRLSGASGDWVDEDVARLASDDPDTVIKDTYNHLYQDTNNGQGAPQTVADVYHRMLNRYDAGDYAGASKDLGLLSHYYADICQPYHTKWDDADQPEHLYYEYTVDDYTRSAADNQDWITPRARKPVVDVRDMTVSAALAARGDYQALRTAWVAGPDGDSHGNFNPSASSTIGSITRNRLSRAANDLADIIAAVPSRSGEARTANITALSTFRRYVGQNSNVAAYATVTDPNGAPLRGVRVSFDWAFSSGTKSAVAYTDATGVATLYQSMGGEKLWYQIDITAKVTTNGVTSVRTEWVMPTPVIGTLKASLSNRTPARFSNVTATAKILDEAGKPIQGLPVAFVWEQPHLRRVSHATTDANGIARSTLNIGRAPRGVPVTVQARCQSANYNRTSTTSFTAR